MNRASARRALLSYFEAPAARLLAGLGLSPNVVTGMGLVLAGVSAYLLGTGYLAAGGAVLLLSGVFDLLDGALARATGRTTTFGAFLDSTIDRVSEIVVLLGLLVYYLDLQSTSGPVLVYAALSGSIMVSYVRARAEGLGVQSGVGLMTRPERIAALGAGLIVGQWWSEAVLVALGIIAVLAALTSAQRVLHVRKALAKQAGGAAEPDEPDGGQNAGTDAR